MELSEKTLEELKNLAKLFGAGSIAIEFNEAEGKQDVVVMTGRKRVMPLRPGSCGLQEDEIEQRR